MRKLLLVTLMLLLAAGGAAQAASGTFDVDITVRTPITITWQSDLTFGTVEADGSNYTVNAVAGSGSPPHSAGQTAQAAWFDIQGENGATADVILPASATVDDGGGNTLSVNLSPQAATHTFDGTVQAFYIGGSVTVPGGTTPGTYTTASPVTFTLLYQ